MSVLKITSLRFFATKSPPPNKKPATSWNIFKKNEGAEKPKPPQECCRRKKDCEKPDPDFSTFGGQAYKTCGTAYVVQQDVIPPLAVDKKKEEDLLVQKMEADLTTKESIHADPITSYRNAAHRLLELSERKLHPLYKRIMNTPKRCPYYEIVEGKIVPYKCHTGPVTPDEIPEHLKINKSMIEKKNIFQDMKRVELPQQLLVKMLEMDKNRKRTLDPKKTETSKKAEGAPQADSTKKDQK